MITTKNIREAHPITDLTSPFTLNGYGFRIKVTKKAADKADTLSVTGKLLGSDTAVTTLIKSEQWSDEIYKEISAAVLTNHNLEWGVEFPTSYSVHYDLDGGIFVADGARVATYDNQLTWGQKATKPATDPTLHDHTFKGWYIVTDGVPAEAAFDFTNTLIYANTTITAVYQENLTVTFNSAGGTAVAPIQVLEGEAITEPTDPTRTGYTFDKWMLGTSAYNFAALVTDDITLTAAWLENFTVTFDSDGGSAVTAKEIADGATATAPTDPTKAGYTFNEWYNGETLFNFTTPITEDITLTAHWLENFTVTFDSQGGTAVTAQEIANGSVATLPDPAPTKAEFTFVHWSTTIDGTEFAFTTPITADITMYAVWTA
jgi:uncharacterized repeat protein (TIGR02543 family)